MDAMHPAARIGSIRQLNCSHGIFSISNETQCFTFMSEDNGVFMCHDVSPVK